MKRTMKRHKFAFLILSFLFVFSSAKGQKINGLDKFDKIVLDAGHGGYDLGACGNKSKEKNVTLSITLKTGDLIREKLPEVEVIYTRTEDKFVPLHQRAKIANDEDADLFISIHCNSNPSPKPFGTETYVMGIHKSQENLEVAKTENSAILMEDNYSDIYDGFDPDSDEDYIMLNMFQSTSIEQSIHFSMYVQQKMKELANVYNRGVNQAGFVVLYLTSMPGVLIETGFLSNPAEEQFLLETENQDKIAFAIYKAVEEYKQYCDELNLQSVKEQTPLPAEKPLKITHHYRIWFTSSEELLPFDNEIFNGYENIFVFQKNGKYQYTFGITQSKKDIEHQLSLYKIAPSVQKKFKENAKILEFQVFE